MLETLRRRLPSRGRIGLFAGPACFAAVLGLGPFGLAADARAVLAVTAWVVVWWTTEAIPIPATSLLPVALFPLSGATTAASAAAPYADPVVFLFLGGFLVSLAVERWNLHHRLSLRIVSAVGTSARRLVLGFMVATGFVSMWISNTATAMMMLPIGTAVVTAFAPGGGPRESTHELSLVDTLETDPSDLPNTAFGTALMLGIAYGASIGGSATLIGSPPNVVFAGVAESSLGVRISFLDWMLVGVPLAALFLLVAWAILVTVLRPEIERRTDREDVVEAQLRALGPMSTGERRVLVVFGLVAAGWILRPFVIEPVLPMVTDPVIAVVGAALVFVVPVGDERLLEWSATSRLPWGVLLLLGAGFSLARAFQASGLDRAVAAAIGGLGIARVTTMVLLVTVVVVVLTNVTSNTATATLFMPITLSIGLGMGVSPLPLMVAAAFAASFAFVLPVATAPNAIVFGSGYLTVPQMARTGALLSLAAVAAIALAAAFWVPVVWG